MDKKLFTYDNIKNTCKYLYDNIKLPYKYIQYSTLGGIENVSVLIHISLESQNKWLNGIYHNSIYAIFHIDNKGITEHFNGYKTKHIRKFKAKNLIDICEKINNIKAI